MMALRKLGKWPQAVINLGIHAIVNILVYKVTEKARIPEIEGELAFFDVYSGVFFGIHTILLFIVSVAVNCSTLIDLFWGYAPFLLILIHTIKLNNSIPTPLPVIILSIGPLFWGLRLNTNNLLHWRGFDQIDWRLQEYKDKTGTYIGYWTSAFKFFYLANNIILYFPVLPLIFFLKNATNDNSSICISLFSMAVMVFGGVVEGISDLQLSKWRHNASNKGKTCREGLWKVTRHPNYLGELIFWIGAFSSGFLLAMFSGSYSWKLIAYQFIGISLIFSVLRGASSPWMERYQISRKKDYANYISEVPDMLIPLRFLLNNHTMDKLK